jgi:hypothetical protein
MKDMVKYIGGAAIFIVVVIYGPGLWNRLASESHQSIVRQANGLVPIAVADRNAMLAGGKVAILTNRKNATICVVATFKNASFKQTKTFNLVFAPNETKEIGGFEGWSVQPGETVELSSDDYEPRTYSFAQ